MKVLLGGSAGGSNRGILSSLKGSVKHITGVIVSYVRESLKFYRVQRYVIKQFLLAFVTCSLFLMILAVVFNLVMDMNWFLSSPEVLSKKFNYIVLAYFLKGPYLYSYLAPLCVLLSISYVISRMSRNFELVAIVNAGVSLRVLFGPLVLVLVLMSVLYFFFLDQVVTIAGKESRTVERLKVWEDRSFQEVNEIVGITEPIKSRNKSITYLEIGFVSRNGVMRNVKINKFFERTGKIDFKHRMFEGGLVEHTVTAEYARWDPRIGNWVLYNVEILSFNEKTELVAKRYLSEYVPDFKLDEPDFFFPRRYDFYFLTLAEMREELNKTLSIRTTFEGGNYYQKLMQMLARPSMSFSLVISGLLALGFVTVISRNLTFLNMVFQSVVRYVLYFLAFIGGMWVGENRILPPLIAVWLPNVVFLAYGVYLNYRVKT